MLLELAKKDRLLIAPREQDTVEQSSSQSFHNVAATSFNYLLGNHAL